MARQRTLALGTALLGWTDPASGLSEALPEEAAQVPDVGALQRRVLDLGLENARLAEALRAAESRAEVLQWRMALLEAGAASSADCCSVAPPALLACAVREAHRPATAAPQGRPRRIRIVTAVSKEVEGYGRYSVAVNAAWARRFGHDLVVHTGGRPADGREHHAAIVGAVREAVQTAPEEVGWILRMDCDAVLADFERDQISRLAAQHPDAEVLLSTAVGQLVSEPSPFNFGVALFRRSAYVAALLDEMWESPYLRQGVDQDLFSLLHRANWSGLASVTAALPETALNSARVAVTAPAALQPIYHLWGHSDDVREAVFREAHLQHCSGRQLLDLNATYLGALEASASGELAGAVVPMAGEVRGDASRALRAWRLAAVLQHWGDAAGAERWWRAGLHLSEAWPVGAPQERLTMWDHLQALYAGLGLTQLLDAQGRMAEAHPVAVRTVEACQRQLQDHFVRLRVECSHLQGSLGRSLLERERAVEAVPHLRSAWQGSVGLHGSGALETARAAESLAAALSRASEGVHPEALPLLRAAEPVLRAHLPEDSGERLLLRARLGGVLESLGHAEEAAAEFAGVLHGWNSGSVQLPGSRLYDVRPLLWALAASTGAPRGGVHGLALLEAMVAALPEAHPQAAWWRRELGLALAERGRREEAEARRLLGTEAPPSGVQTHSPPVVSSSGPP